MWSSRFSYPEKMASLFHKAHAFLPVSVAALLEASPSLISSAVLAFCHRDPIDVKVCTCEYLPEN